MYRLLDTRTICLRYSTFVHLGCGGSYRLEVGRNYEEFADTRGVIGNRKSKKDRQDNAQKKKRIHGHAMIYKRQHRKLKIAKNKCTLSSLRSPPRFIAFFFRMTFAYKGSFIASFHNTNIWQCSWQTIIQIWLVCHPQRNGHNWIIGKVFIADFRNKFIGTKSLLFA